MGSPAAWDTVAVWTEAGVPAPDVASLAKKVNMRARRIQPDYDVPSTKLAW